MIRLQRVGRKHEAVFRVVLTDSHNSTKSGKFKEILGSYDAKAGKRSFKAERIKHWLDKGAQTSNTIHNFLVDEGVVTGDKRRPMIKSKSKEQVEQKLAE